MRILLIAAMLAAGPALADSEAHQGADWVRITARPCTDLKVLEQIGLAQDNPLAYRAAIAEFNGEKFTACWKPMFDREMIYLRYGDGDQGMVPFADLKPVKET